MSVAVAAMLAVPAWAKETSLCKRQPMDPESPPGLAGSYQVVGKDAGTGHAYSGELVIELGADGYELIRTVQGQRTLGQAWIERCGVDEITYLHARYAPDPVSDLGCRLQMDGDNYYRASCKVYQGSAADVGLEAWFQEP